MPEDYTVIRDVVPGITTLSVPLSLGPIKAGARATVVRLSSGNLAAFAPIPWTPAVSEKIRSLGGQVSYIIAPNFEHHLNISAWAKEFPEAAVIGVEGLPEKREKNEATKGVRFAHVFTVANKGTISISPEFDADFAYEFVDAAQNKDLVFVHKPSGTLIEADLLFNLPATEQYSKTRENPTSGLFGRVMGKAFSAQGESLTWQKRNLWYVVGAKNRDGFAGSMRKVLEMEFDRVIPCHGDVIETGGKKAVEEATKWFLEGKH